MSQLGQHQPAGAVAIPATAVDPTTRVLRLAVWCAVVLALATAVAQFVDFGFYDLRYRSLNSNTHASIFGAISLLVDAVAVVGTFLLSGRARVSERFVLACSLVVVLCLRVASPAHALVFALPFTAVALVVLWRQGSGQIQRTIRAGCVLLVVSFIIHAAEMSTFSPVDLSVHSWAYQVRCVLKHDAELAGWVLIAGGILCLRAQIARRSGSTRSTGRRSVTA